jgi:hypothetical protein
MKHRPRFVKEFVEQTFLGNQLSLDRRRFVRCKFYDVTFVYSGGPWHIEDPQFFGKNRVYWRGAARLTLGLWKKLEALGFSGPTARPANRK